VPRGLRFLNNLVAFGSGGVSVGTLNAPTVEFRNNCVFGNTNFNYSDMPNYTGTNGNISVDPRLVSSSDYHLRLDSPCINAGDNSVVQAGWLDIDGQPRVLSGRVDIGADEVLVPFLSSQQVRSGQILLHVDGPSATRYILQATTDFINWLPLTTNAAAPFDFIDPDWLDFRSRFYRTRVDP